MDVRELFRMVARRKWLIAGITVLCAVLAGIAVSQITPRYTSVSKVMLDARRSQVITDAEVVSDLDLSEQVVNGEAAVLRSNVLIEKVIREIGMDRLAMMDPANRPLSLADRAKAAVIGLIGPEPVPPPSPEVAEAARMERLVRAIRDGQTVRREGESFVISILIETEDPVLSTLLANTIADQYIAAQLTGRRETAQRASTSLEDRVAELRAQVEEAEAAVEQYRAEILILEGGSLGAAAGQLEELNNQLIVARSDRIAVEARYTQIARVIEQQGMGAVANIVTSPMIEVLHEELLAATRKDAVWAERYDASHPERVRLAAEIAGIEADLTREVAKMVEIQKSELEVAMSREEAMQKSLSEVEERLLAISRATIGLRQLERESSAKRQTYEGLLERLNETRTQEQLQEPDAVLIERATVPGAPSAPRPKLMVALGGMTGAALAVGLVFFLELTGVAFRSVRELEAETGLPVLDAIPDGRWKTPRAAFEALRAEPYGIYGERIRHLRTALLMRDGRDVSRSIMLASSVPGEGKTTTALALAHMSALAGKSVIVVDCDLRRSSLQAAFKWRMAHDFVDFIENRCDIDEAIHSDPDLGFDVLAASGSHPGTADQLSANWLKPLINELKRVYDVVIVDAPALLAVSDALVLAQAVDSRVYLVRWNDTPRHAVQKGLAAFAEMGVVLDGTVMTMVDSSKSPDTYASDYSYA
ncbi:polysaccharide biosynthesis tyrosine autokinase [Actibacterium sp. MT2.3-13A]|uniref:GumC family protein n=1 Tax=Actibacterium sp. MT2.3-13A TaxID=2828332 RepID=UPI001BA59F45